MMQSSRVGLQKGLKTGPRGGARPSGRCECDDPQLDSVAAVRRFAKQLGECSYCGDRGLELIRWGVSGRYHVRCFVRAYGLGVLATVKRACDRARMCCLGKRRMRELLRLMETAKG
jgi:hypothetical protein